jgi:regulator of ribosome biosynthesis
LIDREDDLEYDLSRIAAFDPHPLDPESLACSLLFQSSTSRKDQEAEVQARARVGCQLIIHHIFQQEHLQSNKQDVFKLPSPTIQLPRMKPVWSLPFCVTIQFPRRREMTRWEKFAQTHGIQKKKKGRMVFDEQTNEWVPRWGYEKKTEEKYKWAVEAKEGEGGGGQGLR